MSNNYIDASGLHTQTLTQIVTDLETAFKSIYGQNINLDPNSPDAQMINIFAQAKIDMIDCITQVYNSFSPNNAIGRVLDQRAALNGVIRKGSTATETNITVTTDRALTLVGRDDNTGTPFRVSDSQNNEFILIKGATLFTGENILKFVSAVDGAIKTTPNTIIKIVTITLGVISVNNPDSVLIQGVDEETDQALRYRRSQSVALPSQGYLEGLTAALVNLEDVVGAVVFENSGSITDLNGIPSHSIWSIVDGGRDSEIGEVIYNKRNAGCGLKGSVSVPVPMINGFNFQILFDRPSYENLWIKLTVTSLDPQHIIDPVAVAQEIFDKIIYKIYQPADYTDITTKVKIYDPYVVVVTGGVSVDNVTYKSFLYPTTIASRFILSVSRILITVV